ncbi:copper amine oxidase N-terminal domain-containing protein [Paenibacillus sp. GCM10027626]|uniref:copper amine oxidase N-terminal domain-containing protein n=1 Tax=Paenibacillus sp. GCM10027626 TaxID=3273411 RepID=UPI003628B574
MKKKLLLLFMAVLMVATAAPAIVSAAIPIHVYVNGERISLIKPPIIQNGSILVPFAPVFKTLDFIVDYDPETKVISAIKDKLKLRLIIGSKYAYVNGQRVPLTIAPRATNGITFVPLRFISEAAKLNVQYDPNNRVVQLGKQVKVPARSKDEAAIKDFRNATWGMTAGQVKKSEGLKLVHGDSSALMYKGKVAALNADILYYFINNKLTAGLYQVNNTSAANIVANYKELKAVFTDKFGASENASDVVWHDEEPEGEISTLDWPAYISQGRAVFYSQWETDTTVIHLIASGESGKTSLIVMYESKEFKWLMDTQQK